MERGRKRVRQKGNKRGIKAERAEERQKGKQRLQEKGERRKCGRTRKEGRQEGSGEDGKAE